MSKRKDNSRPNQARTARLWTGIVLLVTVATTLAVWLAEPRSLHALTKEDGLVENLFALWYLAGFLLCVVTVWRAKRKTFPAIWLVLCLLFLGEETIWFQRVFDYSVLAVETRNAQS